MQHILGTISSTVLFDIIPLDLLLHLIFGIAWTYLGLKKEYSFTQVSIGLVLIALAKEANDYFFHVPASVWEYISDFFITIIYLIILAFARSGKKRLDKTGNNKKKLKIY